MWRTINPQGAQPSQRDQTPIMGPSNKAMLRVSLIGKSYWCYGLLDVKP
jgi:hypothetical protein